MADSWIPHQEGLLGDRHNTGILRVATGYGIDTAGRKVSGAMLAIDWLVVDDVYSCVLLKCDDGRTTFMRAKNMLVAERSPQMAFKRLEGPAYTSCDPILDTQAISTGFVRNCAGNLADLADQVRPHVEKFLAAYYDPEVLKTNVGRPITAREYVFLAPNEYRRQAIEAMPWLLTYFVSEYGTPVVTEIVRVIDGAEELTSALCKCFGVTPSVIRSMAVFSAPAPNSFRLGERQAADAHTILMALSQIPPEQRPSKDRTERFLKVIIWAETLIREAGDQASRSLLAISTAGIWKRLIRRPYLLPEYADVAWLGDMAGVVKNFTDVENKSVEGIVNCQKKSYMPHIWAILYCVCRFHPTDLARLGREWNQREIRFVRHHVREAFPLNFPIASSFPDSFESTNGWKCHRIATVGELVQEAAAASNCLAGYVPQLIRRDVAVYSLTSPQGETEGHFSLDSDGNKVTRTGQVRRYRNRKPTASMKAAAEEFAKSVRETVGESYPPPCTNIQAIKAGLDIAVTAIESAKAVAHHKVVEEILRKAAECFSITPSSLFRNFYESK